MKELIEIGFTYTIITLSCISVFLVLILLILKIIISLKEVLEDLI